MIQIIKTRCSDNIIRYPRINKIIKKEKTETKNSLLEIPENALNFDELYNKTSIKFTGKEYPFCSLKWTQRKLFLVLKTLQNLKLYKIEPELYLNFIFDKQKTYPRAIWPSTISSLKMIKEYQKWAEQFINSKQIKESFKEENLAEVVSRNHQKYLFFKNKLQWSDSMILAMKGSEFDPFYVITTPSLYAEYQKQPDLGFKDEFNRALNFIAHKPREALEFLDEYRRIKCQQSQQHSPSLISFSSPR